MPGSTGKGSGSAGNEWQVAGELLVISVGACCSGECSSKLYVNMCSLSGSSVRCVQQINWTKTFVCNNSGEICKVVMANNWSSEPI